MLCSIASRIREVGAKTAVSGIRNTLAFLAKAIVSVACIVVVVRKVDPTAFGQDLASIHLSWLIAALGQFALLPILGGYRWHLVLESLGEKLGTSVAIRLFWIGMAFSQVLPSISGGDAVRVILAWRRGIALTLSTQSVILERVAMVVTLILIVALMQATGSYQIPGPSMIYPLALLGTLAALVLLMTADKLLTALPPWRMTQLGSQLAVHARQAYRGGTGLKLSLGSFAGHVNTALGCLWLGLSLGMPLHLSDYLFYLSLVTLISTLPLSIGGWGVRESVVVFLF